MTITIAWELAWYQWEVDSDGAGVREVAKGKEVSELSDDAQAWNASADPDGRLSIVK